MTRTRTRTTTRTSARHSVCLAAAATLLTSLAVAGSASTSSAAPAAEAAVSGAITTSAVDTTATAPWTAAAMAAAKPMPLPAPAVKGSAPTSARPTGAAGQIAASTPAGAQETLADEGPAPVSVQPTSGSFTYPTPFDRYNTYPNYGNFPHAATGKLFFRQNGGSFVCSASSLGNDSIWTAGHCVSDGAGHFSTNVVFVPAYKNGAAPYGQFSCGAIAVFSAWHNGANLTRDSGGASCGRSSLGNGRTVQQSVGSLGFAWNQPTDSRHYNVLGYPQAAPFNGQLQVQCQSSFGHWNARGIANTFAVGCDSTGGVSGGPYIMGFRAGNYLNGNASYRYTSPNEPLELYSPYFDDSSKALRDLLIA